MTKKDSTLIVFVVDRSGSMQSIANDMRGGFDALIAQQAARPGECLVTLTRFDTEYEIVYERMDVKRVPPLELVPRGATALLDAVGRTVAVTGENLARMAESERPDAVLVVVITDGEENSSREFDAPTVKRMVEEQQTRYAWDFIFLGANQDAALAAETYGIKKSQAASYSADAGGAQAVMRSIGKKIDRYRAAAVGDKGGTLDALQEEYEAEKKKPR